MYSVQILIQRADKRALRYDKVSANGARVQKMYAKGGYRVTKTELRPTEVDPRFKICLESFTVSKKTNSLKL